MKFCKEKKGNPIYSLFQKTVKTKLVETENEVIYFWNDFF